MLIAIENSTSLEKAIYNEDLQTLEIRFTNGSFRTIMHLPPDVADGFAKAEDKEKFFAKVLLPILESENRLEVRSHE